MNSRTVERLCEMIAEWDNSIAADDLKLYFSHDKKIPDCFNTPCQEALNDGCDYVMILEEDVVPPIDAISWLVEELYTSDIAFYDYPLDQGKRVTTSLGGKIVTGTGCVMFRAGVLKDLMPFSVDRVYDSQGEPAVMPNDPNVYGRQDIDMYLRAHQKGYSIRQVGVADHYHVQEWGSPRTNNGCHQIVKL